MKKINPVLFIINLMVGIFFIIIGAGSFFVRNNTLGLFQLVVGLFLTGLAIYRLMVPPKAK